MALIPTLSANAMQSLAQLPAAPIAPLSNEQLASLLKSQNALPNVVQVFTQSTAPGTLPPQVLTLGVTNTTDLQFVGSLWKTKLATLGGLNTFLVAQAADAVGPQGFQFGFSGSTSRWRSQVSLRFNQPDFDLYVVEFYLHNHLPAPYTVETGYGALNDSGDGTAETVLGTQAVSATSNAPVLLTLTNAQAAQAGFLRFPATTGYQATLSYVRIHPMSY